MKSIIDSAIMDEMLLPVVREWFLPEKNSVNENSEEYEKRQLASFKDFLNECLDDIEKGFRYYSTHGPGSSKSKLLKFTEGEGMVDLFSSMMDGNIVTFISLNITETEMEALYDMACDMKEPAVARQLFMCLLFLNYTNVCFWLGLAYTYVLEGNVEKAKKVYELSLIIGQEDPLPYLYFAKFLRIQKDPLADIAKEAGIKRASANPEYETILAQLQKL